MTLTALLHHLDALQVRWWADQGQLRVSAPDGVLTPELIAVLREHKAALLAHGQDSGTSRDESDAEPLSFAQERLWFLETLGPVGPAYNVAGAIRIGGALDADALAAAFADVQRRHDILRARFVDVDGRPMQVTSPEVATLQRSTWEGRPDAAHAAAIADAHLTFDLGGDALIRATLHRISATEHLLAVTLHHLICDGGSLGVLIADLTEAYRTRVAGTAPDWAPLPFRYADFARRQRATVDSDEVRQAVEYWHDRLNDAPEAISLPTDHVRPAVSTFRGATIPVRLTRSLAAQVTRVAQQCDATPFMVLLSAYAHMLGRFSGQQDVVVGIPVSGRSEGDDGIVGLFVNALPIRVDTAPGQSFADLVKQVRNSVVDAMAHSAAPWEFLLDALAPTRSRDRAPVFQVSFALQADPVATFAASGLTFDDVSIPIRAAKFELSLELQVRSDGELAGVLEFNSDLFTEDTARTYVTQFLQTVESAVSDPSTDLAAMTSCSPGEETFLMNAWQGPVVPFDVQGSLVDAFAEVAGRWPAKAAIVDAGRVVSFGDVDRQRRDVAAMLRRQGVGTGARVGVVVDRSPETIINLLGVLSAGAAYVPIDPGWPAERRQRVEAMAGCAAVLDCGGPAATPVDPAMEDAGPAVTADSAAYVLFTSGSTGEPKGVVVAHGSVRHLIEALEFSVYQPLAVGDDARVSVNGALTFDTSVKQIFQLLKGRTLVLVPDRVRLDGSALLDYIAATGIEVLDATPAQLTWLVEAGLAENPGPLRAVLSGGEALSPALWHRLRAPGAPFVVNLYGPTECTVDATVHVLGRDEERPLLGRPLPNVQVMVLDDRLRPTPVGIPGELVIGGPGVAKGYLGDRQATAAAFIDSPHPVAVPGRVYRTGDRGRVRSDGRIEFLGRIDDQVKIRGHRVELGEIETGLLRHPAVTAAAALVVDEQLMAAVAVEPLQSPVAGEYERYRLQNGLAVAQLNHNESDFLFTEMFERNAYLRHGIHLEPGQVVVDVGSNIGMFALFAHVLCEDLSFLCVEPNPHVRPLLEANLRTFGIRGRVFDCGIADVDGTATFTFYSGFSILSGLHADVADEKSVVRSYIRRQHDLEGSDEATVEEILAAKLRPLELAVRLRPLGDVLDEAGITRIDLLKINVEKAELGVLLGLRDEHWAGIRQIALELHDVDGRLARTLALLRQRGFEVVAEEDWSLEHDAGTNYYLYAIRPGAGQACRTVDPQRLARFTPSLVTAEQIRDHARHVLPDYMVPDVCRVLDRLPITAHGKVDRKRLRRLPWRESSVTSESDRAMTDLEARLAALWRDVLGRESIGPFDQFFDSGGHSLSAARLAGRVRESFGVAFAVGTVFDCPVLADMAACLDSSTRQVPVPTLTAHGWAGPMPLAFAQERMLFLEQLEGGGGAYVIAGAMDLSGAIDIPAFRGALNDVIARHPVLRTVFVREQGDPWARLLDADLELDVIDWSGRDEPAGDTDIDEWIRLRSQVSFDLAKDLPIRVGLLRLTPERHVLAVACHHLVADGWSVALFLREVSELYRRRLTDRQTQVDLPALGYYDYARWQRHWLSGERATADLEYWRNALTGAPPALDLPTDRPRPVTSSYAGASHSWTIPSQTRAQIDAIARSYRATPYMVLLSAFAALLQRWTGQDDVVIGSPVAGRTVPGTEEMIGLFVNTLAMRIDFEGLTTLGELIGRTREVVRGALDHQDTPFEHVVDAVRPPRRLNRHPIFQVMFALQNVPAAALELPGVRWTSRSVDSAVARFDLSLIVEETEDAAGGYRATFEYATALFEPDTIARLCRRFDAVLNALAAGTSEPIATLRVAGPEDLADVRAWNLTDRDYGDFVPVHTMVAQQVALTPDAVALTYRGQSVSYAELWRRVGHVAAHIRDRGVRPGAVIPFITDRSPAWIVSLLATVEVGGLFLPIDPDFPVDRVRWMLEDSAAPLLLTQRHVWTRIADRTTDPVTTPVLLLDDIPAEGVVPNRPPAWVPAADDPAYVIYTSGSTGRPKGAVNLHRGFTNLIRNFVELFTTDVTSQALHFSSISFDSSLCEVFMALAVGGTAVLADRDEILPGAPLEGVLRDRRVTHATIPPSALGGMADPALPDLDVLISAGEVCPPEVVARWAGPRRFFNAYGPTESSVCSVVRRCEAGEGRVPIGRPLRNVRVFVVDPARQMVPVGWPGEIAIGGLGVAQGYLNRADLTAQRFVDIDPYGSGARERVYLTGDQGRYLANGDVEFLGRQDTQIKLRGYRIELGEIETAFRAHAGVRDCAVVVQPGDGGQKRLVAFVVPEADPVPTRALKDHVRTRLPEYMVPPVVVVLERIPQTTSGKRDTKALEAWDVSADRTEDDAAGRVPISVAAESVAGIFAEVLGRTSFSAYDDFFEQGGHSLLAARVIGRVRERLGAELTLRALFESPTPVALAEVAMAAASAGWPALKRAAAPADRLVVSAAQRRLWFLDQLAPSEAYTIAAGVGLRGALDTHRFARAVAALADRHEVLRSVYPAAEGQPRMHLTDATPLRIEQATGWDDAIARAQRDARAPFDLAEGPLFRPVLYRVTAEEHLFAVSMHHIVADGWSIGVLVRDLAAAYQNLDTPAPLQYGDYARWWNHTFTAQGHARLDGQLAYWRDRLAGAPTRVDLPTDRPRPPVQTATGGTLHFAIDATTRTALDALATANQASLFVTVLTAFMIWLSRTSGQSSVIVGTPVANRRDPSLEGVVGLFANTLPLRAEIAVDRSFVEVLRASRNRVLDDLSHPDVPFELIVQALQPERDLSRSPLFQVMFAQSSHLVPPFMLGDLAVEPVTIETGAAKFDLTLFVDDASSGDGLSATLEYNADLFDAATAQRMVDGFSTLLRDVVTRPTAPVGDLDVVSVEGLACLEAWNGSESTVVGPTASAIDLFEQVVDRAPDRVAVEWRGGSLTYGELDRQANQLARSLSARGVTAETLVGVCLERSADLIVALLAIWKADGAYLPLDPHYPSERLTFMLEDSAAALVITSTELAARVTDAIAPSSAILIDADRAALTRLSPSRRPRTTSPSQLAYVIYTSGSTGRPKGVLIEHGGLSNYLGWAAGAYDMGSGAGAPVAGSIGFDATITSVFGPLTVGQRLMLIPEGEEVDALAMRSDGTADHAFWKITPSHLDAVNAALAGAPLAGRVRHLVVGGEALSGASVRPWAQAAPDTMITNEYGPTETVVGCVTFTARADAMPIGPVPIGRPIANTRIFLLDDRRRPVPPGTVGEMYIAGAGVGRGYLRRPELTAERFVHVPITRASRQVESVRCYRTGDLARWRSDGQLEFLGRIDAQVKLRGHRIELGEIESVAVTDPSVAQAAAVLQTGDDGQGRLLLAVVPSSTTAPDETALLARLRAVLPAVMVPAAVIVLPALPLTANGKLDRDAVARLSATTAARPKGGGIASDGLAGIVAEGWRRVIGAAPESAATDFFAQGGHSLLAAQLVAQLRQLCNVDLPVRAVFDHSTWGRLTDAVAAARNRGHSLPPPPGPASGPRVLSLGQQRLWALQQFDDTGAAYHIPVVFELTGDLDADALSGAWDDVVAKHEVLRTRLSSRNGQPHVADVEVAPQVTTIDLSAATPDGALSAVHALLKAPLSMETGPLAKAVLATVGDRAWLFGVVLHHVIADGWSADVLVRDLETAYAGRIARAGRRRLAELPLQYADYAAWQRSYLQGRELDRLTAYWSEALAGAPPVLELPLDRPRPRRQSYEGAVVRATIDADLRAQVQTFARDHHATVYMVLLSAYAALLGQWSGQTDVVVGTTVANRDPGTESVIGFFVNTLPIRLRLEPAQPIGALVAQAREVTLNALDHQRLPFEQLVDLIARERNPAVPPIVQAMFSFQQTRAGAFTLPDVAARPVELPHATAKFDLTLAVDDSGDQLDVVFEYRSDLFDTTTMVGVADRFVTGLRRMVEDGRRRLDDLSFVTMTDLSRLAQWNATDHDYAESRLIHELFEQQATDRPEAAALVLDGVELPYGTLDQQATALARRLRAAGVGPDVLVGICLERSFELFVALLGVLKAGGAYVPLDPDYPAQRLAGMIEDARMPVLITTAAVLGRGVVSGVPDDVTRILMDLPDGSPDRAVADAPASGAPATAASLAYCIFTSGSTGRPKGAAVSHGAIRNRLLWMQQAYPICADDVILHKTPISFDVSVWELFWPLLFGASIVIAKPGGHRDADYLAQTIASRGVTTAHFVPSMLQAFLEEPATRSLSSLRRVFASGEALSWATVRQFADRIGCPLFNLYGPTEAAVDVTAWTCVARSTPHVIPIGTPIANTRIHVLDQSGRRVPIGVPGELFIGGANLARGYVNRPELTAERFVDNPLIGETGEGTRLYRTGDRARWRSDGQLEYLGRLDSQVKLRGFRIELGEIESAMRDHEAVADAAAAVLRGTRLVVWVVPVHQRRPSDAELRAHLQARLPEHMVPSAFVTLDILPLSPSGKLDRTALPEPEAAEPVRPDQPQTPDEQTMAGIWAEVLGMPSVGRDRNFFDAGGDSIRAIQVAARARLAGMAVTPTMLLEHQTVAELCLAAGRGTAPHTVSEQGALFGAVPAAPIVRWFQDLGFDQPQYFNQAVVLMTPAELPTQVLEQALRMLAEHHDALRLRLDISDQVWAPFYAAPGGEGRFRHEAFGELPMQERAAAIDRLVQQAHETIDPTKGPLWNAVHVTFGEGEQGRLIWVVHHLGVDGVSWQILIEDLAEVCAALRDGREPALQSALKGSSWRQWIESWRVAASSSALRPERDVWLAQPHAALAAPPRVAQAARVDRHDTLTFDAPTAVSQALLLAAIWMAWTEVTGQAMLAVDVESHGRTSPDESIDISRTVGWFTAVYPVLFASSIDASPLAVVRRTLRAIPHSGAGFGALKYFGHDPDIARIPRSPILFNFLGHLSDERRSPGGFAGAPESSGPGRSPRNRSPYALEVVAGMTGDSRLEVHWHSPEGGLGTTCVSRLSEAVTRLLATSPGSAGGDPGPQPRRRHEPLVQISSASHPEVGQDREPLFLVHPAGGTVMCYGPLAQRLDRQVFGLQAPGLYDGETPVHTVEDLSAGYVDALLAHHQASSYQLGGWSYGGIVAFDMARRLRRLGRELESLIIFDTLAPGAMPESEWRKDSATLLADIFGADVEVSAAELAGLSLDGQLQRVTERAIASGVFPPTYTMADARRAWAVFQAHRQAERTYAAEPVDVQALVFSSGLRRADADPTLGWGRWVRDVRVVEVPGTHQDVLRAPVVDTVAETILSCREAVRRTRV
jgi:amino acid adenylation domain-containing protein/FkbM family methyltransferase/non-ribosomal peptide synthase protein (TIGR01720 family)